MCEKTESHRSSRSYNKRTNTWEGALTQSVLAVVRVEFGVGEAVVITVPATPPAYGALHRGSTEEGEQQTHGKAGFEGAVRPEPVIAHGDTVRAAAVHRYAEHPRLPGEHAREPNDAVQSYSGQNHKDEDVQPIDIAERVDRQRHVRRISRACWRRARRISHRIQDC